MGAKFDELRAIADARFGAGNVGTWYIGGSTTVSNADGTGFTEPVGGSYARVSKTDNATNFPAATIVGGRAIKKVGTAITFPNPTGNWGALKELGFFTANSGGIPRYTIPLNAEISPKSGNTPVEVAANQAEIPFGGS